MKYKNLSLQPIRDEDIQKIAAWLHKEHISKWYHDPDEWIHEMQERNKDFRFIHHFLVMENDRAVGFCQYYDCMDAKEDWYNVEKENQLFIIDYLIGEDEYLRKGYGIAIVQLLTDTIRKEQNAKKIVVQPEQENLSSCKTLLACNYIYDREKEYYFIDL